jgi:DNA-binding CsgD family transcriptional regulator
MTQKATPEKLEQEVARLQRDLIECKQSAGALREGEEIYRNIFNTAPVPLMVLNFTKLRSVFSDLKSKGISDFRKFFCEHPEYVHEAKQMIDIVHINDAALRHHRAKEKEEILGPIMNRIFSMESDPALLKAIIALAEGETHFEIETVYQTLQGEHRNTLLTVTFPSATQEFDKMLASSMDITEMKQMEEQLRKAHNELESRVKERTAELLDANEQLKLQGSRLEELNAALKVLLQSRENDKKELEEKVLLNVKDLILPYVEKLKTRQLKPEQSTYVEILENNLNDITSSFSRRLSSKLYQLTPKEIEVAGLVRDGKTTKEIADLLFSTKRTIEFHRDNIRNKLGLKSRKANLRSHLQSID